MNNSDCRLSISIEYNGKTYTRTHIIRDWIMQEHIEDFGTIGITDIFKLHFDNLIRKVFKLYTDDVIKE